MYVEVYAHIYMYAWSPEVNLQWCSSRANHFTIFFLFEAASLSDKELATVD